MCQPNLTPFPVVFPRLFFQNATEHRDGAGFHRSSFGTLGSMPSLPTLPSRLVITQFTEFTVVVVLWFIDIAALEDT